MTDDVQLRVQVAYNKLHRTQEMVSVSQELVALRTESSRVTAQQLQQGAALHSQADSAVARNSMHRRSFLNRNSITFRQATK